MLKRLNQEIAGRPAESLKEMKTDPYLAAMAIKQGGPGRDGGRLRQIGVTVEVMDLLMCAQRALRTTSGEPATLAGALRYLVGLGLLAAWTGKAAEVLRAAGIKEVRE